MNRAQRIRELRAQSGRSVEDMATLLDITTSSWLDLELHDDEVVTCISLRQVYSLARALAVSPRVLVSPSSIDESKDDEISLDELADLIKSYMNANGLAQEQFEDEAGWYLAGFLANPETALDEPVMFLEDVCAPLGVPWIRVVTKGAHDARPGAPADAR